MAQQLHKSRKEIDAMGAKVNIFQKFQNSKSDSKTILRRPSLSLIRKQFYVDQVLFYFLRHNFFGVHHFLRHHFLRRTNIGEGSKCESQGVGRRA